MVLDNIKDSDEDLGRSECIICFEEFGNEIMNRCYHCESWICQDCEKKLIFKEEETLCPECYKEEIQNRKLEKQEELEE